MDKAIGIFDSGVGGLSVMREIRNILPAVKLIYFADQENVPYGSRPVEEIRGFSTGITSFLVGQGSGIVVVACNTASAAALFPLRSTFPETPFVGMEPAVKPAAETTHSNVVGVLATPATFQGKLFESVVERFASNVKICRSTCPGLVQQIEAGQLDSPETRHILELALLPMLDAGADAIVLGCTHYPFVIPAIEKIVGQRARVIDPSPAVARQAARIYNASGWDITRTEADLPVVRGETVLYTSGDPGIMEKTIIKLMGEKLPVRKAVWRSGAIVVSKS
jgi:glutamate racemase